MDQPAFLETNQASTAELHSQSISTHTKQNMMRYDLTGIIRAKTIHNRGAFPRLELLLLWTSLRHSEFSEVVKHLAWHLSARGNKSPMSIFFLLPLSNKDCIHPKNAIERILALSLGLTDARLPAWGGILFLKQLMQCSLSSNSREPWVRDHDRLFNMQINLKVGQWYSSHNKNNQSQRKKNKYSIWPIVCYFCRYGSVSVLFSAVSVFTLTYSGEDRVCHADRVW